MRDDRWVVVIQDSNGNNYYPSTVYCLLGEAEAEAARVTKPYQRGAVWRYVGSHQEAEHNKQQAEEAQKGRLSSAGEMVLVQRILDKEPAIVDWRLTEVARVDYLEDGRQVYEGYAHPRRALLLWLEDETQ